MWAPTSSKSPKNSGKIQKKNRKNTQDSEKILRKIGENTGGVFKKCSRKSGSPGQNHFFPTMLNGFKHLWNISSRTERTYKGQSSFLLLLPWRFLICCFSPPLLNFLTCLPRGLWMFARATDNCQSRC